MIMGWEKGACWTSIVTPDAVPKQLYEGCSAIPMRGLSVLSALKKNSLRNLRHRAPKLLRQEDAIGSGHVMWECSYISGCGGATGPVSPVWLSEERGTGLVIGQSFLHKEICILCGPEVPVYDYY